MNRTPPTDEELMLYADDELDGPRREDVELQLAGDGTLRGKLAALRLTGDLIRESALEQAAGFSITDAVMAEIASGKPPAAAVSLKRVGPLAAGTAGARPANDNTRRIFGLAAAAVAAAAALMIWGRMEAGPGGERSPVIAAQTATSTAPVEPSPERGVDALDATNARAGDSPSPEGDMEMGVEVAALDFGAGSGSIFYVPRDSAGAGVATAMTTVVWLADEVGGGR